MKDCQHTIEHVDNLWRVTVTGVESYIARIDRLNEIVSHPDWKPGSDILEDCRGITLVDMDINEIFQITEVHVRKDDLLGNGKHAILVNMGTVGSIFQMWKSNTEGRVSKEIRVFHDRESAENWLAAS